MATRKLSPDQIKQVSELLSEYIAAQREMYAPRGIVLSSQQKVAMTGFFSPRLLETAKLVVLQRERLHEPDCYSLLRTMGFENLPRQSDTPAATFADVVVAPEPLTNGLLFHELVHMEQFYQLGIGRFSEFYVRGLESGGNHKSIPLELQAYSLAVRFEDYPAQQFWVADDVRKWIEKDRF
jgi:hypothetical protein